MGKYLIEAPIDNKNLMEDAFEDEVFSDFIEARGHRKNGKRHLIGSVELKGKKSPLYTLAEGIVDVSWKYGGNTVTIKVIGASAFFMDFDESASLILSHYVKVFKSWECEDNPGLVVRFGAENDSLYVHFFWDTTKS